MNNNDNSILNNYSSPTASTKVEYEGEWAKLSMFNWHGRIGRLRFISWSIKVILLVLIIAGVLGGLVGGVTGGRYAPESVEVLYSLIVVATFVATFILQTLVTIKRLHDFNLSGWLVILTFVPLINFILWLVCLFKAGDEENNEYGFPEPALTWLDKIMITLFFLMPVLGIIAAILIPAFYSIS